MGRRKRSASTARHGQHSIELPTKRRTLTARTEIHGVLSPSSKASLPPVRFSGAVGKSKMLAADDRYPEDQLRPYMKAVRPIVESCPNTANPIADSRQNAPRRTVGQHRQDKDGLVLERGGRGPFSSEMTGGLAENQRVKSRMMDIEPRGWKYVVTCTLSENLGQAGRWARSSSDRVGLC